MIRLVVSKIDSTVGFILVETQRKVFADLATQTKKELISKIEDRESVSLLENIPADEATDVLLTLPKGRTAQLMRLMETKTSKRLRKLLGFSKHSAGGLMTAEYLTLPQSATVGDALALIKINAQYPGNIYQIFIVDDQHRLSGVTGLRQFINADPGTPIMQTCFARKVYVHTDAKMEEIALLLEKYKVTSIAVIDDDDILQGVITIDDVMEQLIALIWSKYKDKLE